ncbi:M28 family peptidase [Isosphaeraceae bacterium EP7]
MRLLFPIGLAALLGFSAAAPATADEPPGLEAALAHIGEDSLKGHVSFLASDLLEGRDTPSRGLDLAALYIASQFRAAGLQPLGDDGYFQTAKWVLSKSDPDAFRLQIDLAGKAFTIPVEGVSLNAPSTGPGIQLDGVGLFKVDATDAETLSKVTEEQVGGKVVVTKLADPRSIPQANRGAAFRAQRAFIERLGELKAVAVLSLDSASPIGSGVGPGRLIDPEATRQAPIQLAVNRPTMIALHEPAAVAALEALPVGPIDARLSLSVAPSTDRPAIVRNVIGMLKGSDPELASTYVMVTAHYDHLGTGTAVDGDRIFNGANDDASGTASVVEIAGALATLKERPKRSIVFMTFFGEEKGLLGSRYYAKHPAVPLAGTVADINLEHVGRTDDLEGPTEGKASMTGFDFSDLGTIFQAAGKAEQIEVTKHPKNSDLFFSRSDNQALADLGIPAHSLCTAFLFPDYHALGDHWEKLNYPNMVKVDRLVARALVSIADNPEAPRWNAENPKAKAYLDAWQTLHPSK